MSLRGMNIAGTSTTRQRAEHDFYATNPEAVKMLARCYKLPTGEVLEPCVGNGNIIHAMEECFPSQNHYTAIDIVDRGYEETIVEDYLSWETDKKYDLVITNPPFSHAVEFIERGYEQLKPNGVMAMYLKIQFLEGQKRKEFFKKYPMKYVYVFPNRMSTWMNGNSHDPITGRKYVTTFCFAWFVWEKGFTGEPTIRWL